MLDQATAIVDALDSSTGRIELAFNFVQPVVVKVGFLPDTAWIKDLQRQTAQPIVSELGGNCCGAEGVTVLIFIVNYLLEESAVYVVDIRG